MKFISACKCICMTTSLTSLYAQESVLEPQALRQAISADKDKSAGMDAAPKSSDGIKPVATPTHPFEPLTKSQPSNEELILKRESQKHFQEIKALKAQERSNRRFAEDLFEFRDEMSNVTEGGITEDYVLGVGDQMLIAGFGSATFEVPGSVDGRGEVLIPKVGTVKVAGMTLGKAKTAIQNKVNQQLSGTSVGVSLTKLRQVRVFVMGEVYKPGSYLVPSLSSVVNVLGLAGGPTALGSFRQIRLMRGGRVVHQLDLYPLRAEGQGNFNLTLQNGDTLFVPLAANTVMLQGGFLRIMGGASRLNHTKIQEKTREVFPNKERDLSKKGESVPDTNIAFDMERSPVWQPEQLNQWSQPMDLTVSEPKAQPMLKEPRKHDLTSSAYSFEVSPNHPDDTVNSISHLQSMHFEMLPGESVQDALRFAGGLLPQAFGEGVTLRRLDKHGIASVMEIPIEKTKGVEMQRGDVLTALPRRNQINAAVTVTGWARVPGTFMRKPGLKVGDLLKSPDQIMPDTYLQRGEILRTLSDGGTQYLAFNVQKALEGDPQHNLLLEDRDRVSLHQKDRMRPWETVSLSGPFTHAGTFVFHEGMRAADLIFQAGVPKKSANRMVCELARSRYGQPSEVHTLDLAKLLSTETNSPVAMNDETANPRLQADDKITIYEKPEFRIHRTVTITGQVQKPGSYVLDTDKPTLSYLITRAGGFTSEAMPNAGIFFRHPKSAQADVTGMHTSETSGITEILERLNETKIVDGKAGIPGAGGAMGAPNLFKIPVLHGLGTQKLNRVVVDFQGAVAGKKECDIELQEGDEIVIPRRTETAMIIGETSTPFAFYHVKAGMDVGDLLKLAGGVTRNADTWNIRLLKADGRIFDSWVKGRKVEPGDAVLVPQVIHRSTTWQENLTALTPIAIMINALRR